MPGRAIEFTHADRPIAVGTLHAVCSKATVERSARGLHRVGRNIDLRHRSLAEAFREERRHEQQGLQH